jgi:hypothetical protein
MYIYLFSNIDIIEKIGLLNNGHKPVIYRKLNNKKDLQQIS